MIFNKISVRFLYPLYFQVIAMLGSQISLFSGDKK